MTSGTILYEIDNLTRRGGTGVATYARTLAEAAGRLGYAVDGLFDVRRTLRRGEQRLNEVLAFDATDEYETVTPLQRAWRHFRYPFNALVGLGPTELALSGLVMGPAADALRPFRRAFAVTRLIEMGAAHLNIYGRLARLRLTDRPSLFHATHPVPLAARGCPNLYTIHDLVPLRLPYATLDDKNYFYRLLRAIGRTADHIVHAIFVVQGHPYAGEQICISHRSSRSLIAFVLRHVDMQPSCNRFSVDRARRKNHLPSRALT